MILRHKVKADSQNSTPFVKKNCKADYRYRSTPTTEIFQNNPEKVPKNPEKSKILERIFEIEINSI